jgi:hypothetical protein
MLDVCGSGWGALAGCCEYGNEPSGSVTSSVGRCELDSSSSGWGTVTNCCEHGNEPSGSIKCWEFLD